MSLTETCRSGVNASDQAVGVVRRLGEGVAGVARGDRLGVPWLGGACGTCFYCQTGHENLARPSPHGPAMAASPTR